jgi:hypothetical protein
MASIPPIPTEPSNGDGSRLSFRLVVTVRAVLQFKALFSMHVIHQQMRNVNVCFLISFIPRLTDIACWTNGLRVAYPWITGIFQRIGYSTPTNAQ